MSLKETWNRIAFGSNSTGQRSSLLREFRDTSDPDQFQDLVDTTEVEIEDLSFLADQEILGLNSLDIWQAGEEGQLEEGAEQ